MDPNACVDLMTQYRKAGDYEALIHAWYDLTLWMLRGGFAPDEHHAKVANSIISEIALHFAP